VRKLMKLIERKKLRRFIEYMKEKDIDLNSTLQDPESSKILGTCLHLACQNDRSDIVR
jgi:hypothetical protein